MHSLKCQPPTNTPSTPRWKARRTWCGDTLPLHITRTVRTFAGYCKRLTPARSAAAYAHQVQRKQMILGSKMSSLISIPYKMWLWPECIIQYLTGPSSSLLLYLPSMKVCPSKPISLVSGPTVAQVYSLSKWRCGKDRLRRSCRSPCTESL